MAGIFRRVLCWFGIHVWVTFTTKKRPGLQRFCAACGKKQHQTYDMAYGGTYWADGSVE